MSDLLPLGTAGRSGGLNSIKYKVNKCTIMRAYLWAPQISPVKVAHGDRMTQAALSS